MKVKEKFILITKSKHHQHLKIIKLNYIKKKSTNSDF